MIEADVVAKRLDRREGAKVVSYREVGLPIFRLNSLITLQDTSSVGAIEEFVLRCVSQKIETSADLEVFLGLPARIVAYQLGQLLHDGALGQVESVPPRYCLTSNGKRRIEELSLIRISKEQIPLYIDGITRRAVPADPVELWSSSQLEQVGVVGIPPTPRRPPRALDIDLGEVNRNFAAITADQAAKKRAIRFDAITGRITVLFRRAVAVAFKSDDGRRMSIGFAIDGRESEEHELAYARTPDIERSVLFGTLFNSDKRRREVQTVVRELRSDIPDLLPAGNDGSTGRSLLTLRRTPVGVASAVANVGVLSVYDHPPLLRKAFETAKARLLIISPWIRANVVNQEFVGRLIQCLERGVEVTIAYGIGRRDVRERDADVTARESLAAIAQTFRTFRFIRKGDTHAKILLVDSAYFVTTSFNWLSFSGDPSQPMREEEGTLVEDPTIVDAYYKKLMARIVVSA